jgi:DNA-binding transcriptional ArsR family regulator
VNELVAGTAVSQPAVSQHLQVLRAAGLVEVRKQGAQRIYSVRPEGLRQLRDWIELCLEGSGPTATA